MSGFFTAEQRAVLTAACALLVPFDGEAGAVEAGAVEYIETFLDAFSYDPPRIWAGGPFSGRAGGSPAFSTFQRLTALEELAWRTRIEGSLGIAERERLGPVTGLQEIYVQGLAALGTDFAQVDQAVRNERLTQVPEFTRILYGHICEGMYGAPEYGGNKQLMGWNYVNYGGDSQPRGYTDTEVSGR